VAKVKELEAEAPVDDEATLLAQLGAELQAVASDKLARTAKLKQIEQVLGGMSVKDYAELAESPIIQNFAKMFGADDLAPGQVKNRGTLAERTRDWTMHDVNELIKKGEMPLVRFTPNESLPLTWNGLQIYVIANEECEVPRCFYDIYKEHVQAVKQAQINERYLLGVSDVPPHPNWQTEESARVRAWSMQGPRGTSGGTLTTGRIHVAEESEAGK
jgi:hypothetical protein